VVRVEWREPYREISALEGMNDERFISHVDDPRESIASADSCSGPLEPLHDPMVVAHFQFRPFPLECLLIQDVLLDHVRGNEGRVQFQDEAELVIEGLDQEGRTVKVLPSL